MRKDFIILLLAIAFAINSTGVYAVDSPPVASVTFEASDLDEEGHFTVSMRIFNATFNTFQFGLRYDKSAVAPVDAYGVETALFQKFAGKSNEATWMSSIGTNIDTERGLIEFAGYVTPGSTMAKDGLERVPGHVAVGNSGTEVYIFNFKKKSLADVMLAIAKQSESDVYSKSLPQGAGLFSSGKTLPLEVTFLLPKGSEQGQPAAPLKPGATEPEMAMTSKKRLESSLILQIGNAGTLMNGERKFVDAENKDVAPYIDENDRTMVPVRFVAESLGASVEWNRDFEQVSIHLNDKVINMFIGSTKYLVDGEAYFMDTIPVVIKEWNRTVVPMRFIAEALGQSVEWDAQHQLILITPLEIPWMFDRQAELEAKVDILRALSLSN